MVYFSVSKENHVYVIWQNSSHCVQTEKTTKLSNCIYSAWGKPEGYVHESFCAVWVGGSKGQE